MNNPVELMRGRFITFEGIEGAGKTTQILRLRDYLVSQKIDCLLTREPGGTEVAEVIRSVVLDKTLQTMHSDTELLLIFAARAEHLQQKILPALQRGQWVLCDRFTDASYAYQGYGRGISLERMTVLEQWVQGELQPDLTLLFDLPVAMGLSRAGKRGEADRFESETVDFFTRVRDGYLQRAHRYPERFRVIDASADEENVWRVVRGVYDQWLMA
jgi:dTMP kinase